MVSPIRTCKVHLHTVRCLALGQYINANNLVQTCWLIAFRLNINTPTITSTTVITAIVTILVLIRSSDALTLLHLHTFMTGSFSGEIVMLSLYFAFPLSFSFSQLAFFFIVLSLPFTKLLVCSLFLVQ